ncbi:MAG: O-antigen ligase family protein [Patescibacteria group bacterium]|mgnify:CR=1 FL=1
MELTNLADGQSILVLLALAAFAYLTWQKPIHGLYLLTAALPAYVIRPTFFGLPTTVLELSILILFFIWLAKDGRWRRINWRFFHGEQSIDNPIPPEFRLALSLILVCAGIALVLSPAPAQAFGIFKAYFIEPVMYLIVFLYEVRNTRHAEHIFWLLGLTTIVIGILAFWQYETGLGITNPFWADAMQRRSTTFFGYPNANSLFVTPIVALYLGYFSKRGSIAVQIFKVGVIALGLITIIAAKTTGALLAIVILAWILALRLRKARGFFIAVVIIAITLTVHTSDSRGYTADLMGRIARNELDLDSTSLEIRVNQWRETWTMLLDHPVRGGGLANYQQSLAPYHSYDFLEIYLYPQSLLLNFWSEIGLLGLLAFLWLGVVIFRRLYRALSMAPPSADDTAVVWGVTLAWIVTIIHGLVDVPYFKNDLSILWMLLVGLTIVATRYTAAGARKRSN